MGREILITAMIEAPPFIGVKRQKKQKKWGRNKKYVSTSFSSVRFVHSKEGNGNLEGASWSEFSIVFLLDHLLEER